MINRLSHPGAASLKSVFNVSVLFIVIPFIRIKIVFGVLTEWQDGGPHLRLCSVPRTRSGWGVRVRDGTCLCQGASSVELNAEKRLPTVESLVGTGRFPGSVACSCRL